jgi:hypothetical protein
MIRTSVSRTVLLAALIAAAELCAPGCAKKITAVDPHFVSPEGSFSPDARLLVYPDLPTVGKDYLDIAPVGPDPGDKFLGFIIGRVSVPGTIHGLVIDGTNASTYQVLRRESNGGYLPLKDFVERPDTKFLDSHWELYTFQDNAPSSFIPATYLGRGLVGSSVTATSPLTNTAQLTGQTVANMRYSGPTSPTDSLFPMSWGAVPKAKGYWVQVYQFRGAATDEKILSGAPAPMVVGRIVDLFLGYVPAPDTAYKIGNPGADVLTRQLIILSGEYLLRVSAVDSTGRLIAFTYGDSGIAVGATDYLKYPLGAVKITPKHLTPAPHGAAENAGWGEQVHDRWAAGGSFLRGRATR